MTAKTWPEMSPAYVAAREVHAVAIAAFDDVQMAFRARRIDAAQFCGGRLLMRAADAVFDAAFAAEREQQDAVERGIVPPKA